MGKVFKALSRAADAEKAVSTEQPLSPATDSPYMRAEQPIGHDARQHRLPVVPPSAQSGQWDERLVLAMAMTGPVAENIRGLRTRILHPFTGKRPRSLLITSASPEEGKSFICANLAISLAQGVDNYCLLVDCDLRRPTQHTLFGLDNRTGLSDYLQKTKALPELIARSGVDKLSILPSGPLTINPAELLGSSYMASLVEELMQRYDDRIVLLDSPPLHAASETAVLAQHVDGVILVVRSGFARREHVKTLVEAIGRDKITGIVFNAYTSNLIDTKIFGYYEQYREYYGRS